MIPLPEWIDREAWDEYVAMRIKDKKPMTPRSAKARLARLMEFRAKGHDVTAIIDEAINGHWLDFYEPKDKPITDKRQTRCEALVEMDKHKAEPPSPEVRERMQSLVAHLRRA